MMYTFLSFTMSTQVTSGQQTGVMTEQEQLAALVTQEVASKYPDILQMLFATTSLNFEEKRYWVQLLPLMTEEHIERLRTILVTEQQKLQSIEEEFVEKAQVFNAATRLSREEITERRETLRAKEAASQQEESSEEENLLNQLDTLSDE